MKIKLSLLFVFYFSITFINAQTKQWKLISENNSFYKTVSKTTKNLPSKYQVYASGIKNIKEELTRSTSKVIELPTSNGIQKFTFQENSSLSPELSKKFPTIKSFVAKGVSDTSINAIFSIGTNGLNAVIYSTDDSPYYLDSYSKNKDIYIGYNKKDAQRKRSDFECKVEGTIIHQKNKNTANRDSGDNMLRTYRLALACTGEYAQFHLAEQNIDVSATEAVKKESVLSAMNTTITRVNAVFMRDLGVKMEIVANNDQLIFLDESTDGLSNDSAGTLISQSQTKCDDIIGNTNYDIGHTFSTGAGGLAGLGVVCATGQKGRGVTGRSEPVNNSFDIDYVAHEIGHQFGGNHTFNGTLDNCSDDNRNDGTAVEPGSGTTIMAYAGICGSDNVQSNSDDYFHSISIAQMWNVIQSSGNCATLNSTNNSMPTANAGSDFSIPKSTPFVLKGEGSDSDSGNNLTYNWEQIDTEVEFAIPILSTNTGGAMFRSLPSNPSPNRYMPALATVVAGNTATSWEVLPSVARELNFSLVVRDNNITGGNTKRDDVNVTITDTEAFIVTAPNSSVSWTSGSTQTISWNKGTSDIAPINCQNVNIKLSTDGGLTFPITIKSNTPNDGTEAIIVPSNLSTTARIMVEAADNIFYNVNSTNFTIVIDPTASVKDFAFSGFNLYPNPSTGKFTLNLELINTGKVSVRLFDVTGRLINEKNFFNKNTFFSEKINFNNTAKGLYLVKITNGNRQTTRKLIIE